jgi:hypothetical protein
MRVFSLSAILICSIKMSPYESELNDVNVINKMVDIKKIIITVKTVLMFIIYYWVVKNLYIITST